MAEFLSVSDSGAGAGGGGGGGAQESSGGARRVSGPFSPGLSSAATSPSEYTPSEVRIYIELAGWFVARPK